MTEIKVTVRLTGRAAEHLLWEARTSGRTHTAVATDALKRQLEVDLSEIMRRGYIETREESRRMAEEAWPLAVEQFERLDRLEKEGKDF